MQTALVGPNYAFRSPRFALHLIARSWVEIQPPKIVLVVVVVVAAASAQMVALEIHTTNHWGLC